MSRENCDLSLTMSTRSKAQAPPLANQAYNQVRDAILNAKLPPGAAISQRALAEKLGVSTVPVSRAIQRLEAEGFVETRPKAGTRVKIPTSSEIRGAYVLREALETQSARLFSEVANAKQRDKLVQLAARLDTRFARLGSAASNGSRRNKSAERDHVDFHIYIARVAGCPELREAIERSRVLLFNWLFTASGHLERLPEGWHGVLAAVLTGNDALAAGEAMRHHVRYRMEEVIDKFRAIASKAQPDRIARGPQNRTIEKSRAAVSGPLRKSGR